MTKSKIKGLVSITMPVFNCEKYIEDSISSVLAQTYSNWELIIVDDGSTDNTLKIVDKYDDARINVYKLEKNMGRGFARNYAIEKCKGEYIAIFDADDISLKNRLELQVSFLKNNPAIDIIGGQILHFEENSKERLLKKYKIDSTRIKEKLNKGVMEIPHSACLFRVKCFEKNKYEPSISMPVEDLELFYRLNKFYNMANLNEFILKYRNNFSPVSLKRFLEFRKKHNYAIYVSKRNMSNKKFMNFDTWVKREKTNQILNLPYNIMLYFYLKIK